MNARTSSVYTREFDVFLFANPRSGSREAKKFILLDFDIC